MLAWHEGGAIERLSLRKSMFAAFSSTTALPCALLWLCKWNQCGAHTGPQFPFNCFHRNFPKQFSITFTFRVFIAALIIYFKLLFLQVTVEYKDNKGAMEPLRVHTVVISVQHHPDITLEEIRRQLMEKVVKVVIPAKYLDDKTVYHLLPSGLFLMGGPQVRLLAIGEESFRTDYSVCFVYYNWS